MEEASSISPAMASHFFALADLRYPQTLFLRAHLDSVSAKCFSKAAFSSREVAFLAIFGKALSNCFSRSTHRGVIEKGIGQSLSATVLFLYLKISYAQL